MNKDSMLKKAIWILCLSSGALYGAATALPPSDQSNIALPTPPLNDPFGATQAPAPSTPSQNPNFNQGANDQLPLPQGAAPSPFGSKGTSKTMQAPGVLTPLETGSQPTGEKTEMPSGQSSTSAPAAGEKENLKVIEPASPPRIEESKVTENEVTPADQFMRDLAFEAVSSSQDWRKRWYAPDFGHVSIYSVSDPLDIPHGVILPWRHDAQGVPEVVLHALIRVPSLRWIMPTDLKQPLGEIILDIRQYISFYFRPEGESAPVGSRKVTSISRSGSTSPQMQAKGAFPYYSGVILKRDGWAVPASQSYSASPYYADQHQSGAMVTEQTQTEETVTTVETTTKAPSFQSGWMASASPYYVMRVDEDNNPVSLLDVQEGKGAWNARVGEGGLLIKDFIEGGLAAARTQVVRTFRDEEIQWFLKGNSDVLFYLRPQ